MLMVAFGISILALFILPIFQGSEKLRGNAMALAECSHHLRWWKSVMTNNSSFDFEKLSEENKNEAIYLTGLRLDLWLKTNFYWTQRSNREVVIVCGKKFSNVHKPGFLNSFVSNPAHAVGYSDGTVGLVSPTEFSKISLNGFVSLASLATNPPANISSK